MVAVVVVEMVVVGEMVVAADVVADAEVRSSSLQVIAGLIPLEG